MTAVEQTGAQFRLEWELETPEAVEVRRTTPEPATLLATVPADVTTYVDTLDVDAGDSLEWTLTGVTSSDVTVISATAEDVTIPPLDDERRYTAALLTAARLYKRKESPLGVAGGGELGPIMLRFKDPDVEQLLVGLRSSSSDLTLQTWPTVTELRAYVKAGPAVAEAELSIPLAAGIEIIKRRCAGFGIA